MQTEQQIEEKWSHGWSYHLIPSGKHLRAILIQRLGEEWLEAHQSWIADMDAPLQSAYVMVCFRVYGRAYELRNHGYSDEDPRWRLAGRNTQGKWFHVDVPDENLKESLEQFFQQ